MLRCRHLRLTANVLADQQPMIYSSADSTYLMGNELWIYVLYYVASALFLLCSPTHCSCCCFTG